MHAAPQMVSANEAAALAMVEVRDVHRAFDERLLPEALLGGAGAGRQVARGAVPLLASIRRCYPWLRHVFADGGYAGQKLLSALRQLGQWRVQIVKRSDTAKGFELLPRRWVVERTFAWLGRNRRLAKDFETTIASATAWTLIASIRLMAQRLASG